MHIRSHSPEAAPDRGRSLISTIACSARNEKRGISNSRCSSVCHVLGCLGHAFCARRTGATYCLSSRDLYIYPSAGELAFLVVGCIQQEGQGGLCWKGRAASPVHLRGTYRSVALVFHATLRAFTATTRPLCIPAASATRSARC